MSQHQRLAPHIRIAHDLWERHVSPSDIAIDMTVGNGHDTLFLSSILPLGQVYGFDIQLQAIESTKKRVQNTSNVTLIHASHETIDTIACPKPPSLIVYNLGYLPGGNKCMTTTAKTTLASLKKAIALLAPNGMISITCYPGHDEGKKETDAVALFVDSLSHVVWDIETHLPPSSIMIKPRLHILIHRCSSLQGSQ